MDSNRYMSSRGAGSYPDYLQRLVRTLSNNVGGLASKEYTYAASGDYYWGSVEQTGSQEVEVDGRIQTKTMATIRVRGWVTLTTLDRLVDQQFGQTYRIVSIARGADELLVEAYVW